MPASHMPHEPTRRVRLQHAATRRGSFLTSLVALLLVICAGASRAQLVTIHAPGYDHIGITTIKSGVVVYAHQLGGAASVRTQLPWLAEPEAYVPGVWQLTFDGLPLEDQLRLIRPQATPSYTSPADRAAQAISPSVGLATLAAGDFAAAQDLYAAADGATADPVSTQLLALAVAGRGDFARAGALLAALYQEQPDLRFTPLPAAEALGQDQLRSLTGKAYHAYERQPTADRAFLLALLLHARGDAERAEQVMAERDAILRPRA